MSLLVPHQTSLIGLAAYTNAQLWDWLCQPPPVLPGRKPFTLGRYVHMTRQTNLIGFIFFALTTFAATIGSDQAIRGALEILYPLCMTLGTFMTLAYYTLVHSNPEFIAILPKWEAGDPKLVSRRYPKVKYSLHATHAHGAPVSLLLVSATTTVPEHTALIVCVYYALYAAMTIGVSWGVDGKWPYPFLEQAHAKGGYKQVLIVVAVLSLVCAGIGLAGKAVAAMRLT